MVTAVAAPSAVQEARRAPAGRGPSWLAVVVEAGALAGLLALVSAQYRGHKADAMVSDWDHYVEYADAIRAPEGPAFLERLKGRRISAGYPLLLAGVAEATGTESTFKANFRMHHATLLLLVLAVWGGIRRAFGPGPALLFAGILAAPNNLIRWAAIPMSDFTYTLLWIPTALLAFRWLLEPKRVSAAVPAALAVLLAAMTLVRSTTATFLVLFLASVALAAWAAARAGLAPRPDWARLAGRAAVLAGVVALSTAAIGRLADYEPQKFYRYFLSHVVVQLLPAASDTPADARIEAAKVRLAAVEGQRLQDHLPQVRAEFADPDVEAVWQGRVVAYPHLMVARMLREFRWRHFLLARDFVPFQGYTGYADFKLPLTDDSFASRLFRATGIVVRPGDSWRARARDLALAAGVLAACWAPLVAGLVVLGRRWPVQTAAVAAACLLNCGLVAATVMVYGRYLAPWAVAIYAAQAVGLWELGRAGARRFNAWREPAYAR